MPSVEKIIEKMKRQPNGIRPEEADKVLRAYGYEGVRQKGSHKSPDIFSDELHCFFCHGVGKWRSRS